LLVGLQSDAHNNTSQNESGFDDRPQHEKTIEVKVANGVLAIKGEKQEEEKKLL
jgi:HSP20 family molecular chaperone IbpA